MSHVSGSRNVKCVSVADKLLSITVVSFAYTVLAILQKYILGAVKCADDRNVALSTL